MELNNPNDLSLERYVFVRLGEQVFIGNSHYFTLKENGVEKEVRQSLKSEDPIVDTGLLTVDHKGLTVTACGFSLAAHVPKSIEDESRARTGKRLTEIFPPDYRIQAETGFKPKIIFEGKGKLSK